MEEVFMSLRETQWEAVLTASNRNLTKPEALWLSVSTATALLSDLFIYLFCIGQGEFTVPLQRSCGFQFTPFSRPSHQERHQ